MSCRSNDPERPLDGEEGDDNEVEEFPVCMTGF